MQTFKDTQTGQYWQFDDADDVRLINGVYQVFDVEGNRIMSVPETLIEVDSLPEPESAPPHVPQQVTNAQGVAALIQAGLWQSVLDYVDAMTDPTEKALAEVALHRTTHWRRDSPFLTAAAAALGLTDQQLDDLFVQAAEIRL